MTHTPRAARNAGILLILGSLTWGLDRTGPLGGPLSLPAGIPILALTLIGCGILALHSIQARAAGVPGVIYAIAFAGVFFARVGALTVDAVIASSGVAITSEPGFETSALRVVGGLLALVGCFGFAWTLRRTRVLARGAWMMIGASGTMGILAWAVDSGSVSALHDATTTAAVLVAGTLSLRARPAPHEEI